MPAWSAGVQSGTRGAQPTPASDAAGVLYFVSDEDVLERWSGSAWSQVATNTAALTSATAVLANDVALTNSNTWYNGPSVSLAAGTWLVTGQGTGYGGSNANHQLMMRLYNSTGAACLAEGQHFDPYGNWHSVGLSALVTLATTSTVVLQGCLTIGGSGALTASLSGNGSTKATVINAVRVA